MSINLDPRLTYIFQQKTGYAEDILQSHFSEIELGLLEHYGSIHSHFELVIFSTST